ncbi:sialidase family protein [Paenibacillus contaminans]|uniref:Sialidase domain-containing protein n=1 Tax=Paenibacillus contaminans TaxID=450362 RepID=A0A329MUL0_9BACL|nr:sialidase family protein [Paenibacillus contaminans]RAV22373.1 hypothetical protein DQG23_05365 [Paenibacillus contaminans]
MQIKPLKHIVIFEDEQYNTFPSLVVNRNGIVVAGFRQAPDRLRTHGLEHIDPSSKAVVVTSEDGENWCSKVRILYDDYFYGVQDPCLNVLRDGTILSTIFMWKVAEREDVEDNPDYHHGIFHHWAAKPVGSYTIRSSDGGQTWDEPIPTGIEHTYIRGNCAELDDGSILAPLYGYEEGTCHVIVAKTENKGRTWVKYAIIPAEDGYDFYEPNFYRTRSGKLVAFIRSTKKHIEPGEAYTACPLFTSESADNGLTWSRLVKHPYYSPSPFHVLELESGHVLLTYGYRYKPYGIRAILLDPECGNLADAKETVIREDGHGSDIGYTSAVQLKNGTILVAYYYSIAGEEHRYIAGTLCELAAGASAEGDAF